MLLPIGGYLYNSFKYKIMSQITHFILELNLVFAGGIILIILHGMFFSKKNNHSEPESKYDLPYKKMTDAPKSTL